MLDLSVDRPTAAVLLASPRFPTSRVLALVTPSFDADVRRILGDLALEADVAGDADEFVRRLFSVRASLALVDIDAPGVHRELLRATKAAARGLVVVGMAYYWSDGEAWARGETDGLVHKPPRAGEWSAQFRRLGVILPPAA